MSLTIESLNHQITDGHGKRQLLSDLSLTVGQGECIGLMGDSGSGKTTLLNLIAGLEPIQQGQIILAGVALAQASEQQLSDLRKTQLGIIFQQYNLLSSLSVQDNIAFSARLADRYDASLCTALARQLDIQALLNQYPLTLSGGEMQRVAIARAMSAQPQLLLADEPTGNLDDNNSSCVVELLVKLAKSHNTALVLVTHSHNVAAKMDKIYQLADGQLTLVNK
ncbi:ABC transporter ATP-binding protein [Moritella yayanosii]|uniref:Putative ABC transporter, ATP-binding protein n=1 Tax=Moritella yayanosii TaxID=69539 RepID=A0A330LLY6_9GAMM|nr:ABC transporter ATP-binding protein [Moritella yayanosii]SQD77723.1 putative ABC transporter, ATP-binding protein [Moritella yayanosii]